MSPVILNLILWVPFVLTVVISGILFCRSGYKKGLWRALIAFGATLVAAAVSILLAGLLSTWITPAITGVIPANAFGNDPLTSHMALVLVGMSIRSALSMVLFWLLMLIFTIVLRILSSRIQADKLLTDKKSMRWLGFGVGVLSAVVFALLWLCPLYSSLAVFAPVADNVLANRDDQVQLRTYVQSVRKNPVVAVYGTAPMRLVYNGAASTGVGSATVPFSDMAAVAEEATGLYNLISTTQDPVIATEQSRQLVSLLRSKVVNQKWFHALSMALVKEASVGAAQVPGGKGVFLQEFIGVFDLPQDVFTQNSDALLNFLDYALDNGIVAILQNAEWDKLYTSGILEKAGALINCTPEAAKLKGVLVTEAIATSLFEGDFDAAQALLKDHPIDMTSDPQLQLREAEAITQYFFMSHSPVEFVLRFPALAESALDTLISQADLMAFSGLHPETQESIRGISEGKPEYQKALYAQAQYCAQAPLGSASFQTSCHLLLALRNFSKTNVMSYYEEYDANSLRFALDTMGINAFVLMPAGKKVFVVMDLFPELMESNPNLATSDLSSGINGLHGLIFAAVKHTILNDPDDQNVFDLKMCVQMYANNQLMIEAVKQYVDTHNEDPLQLGSKLSDRETLALQNMINGYYRDNELDADALSVSPEDAIAITPETIENSTIVVPGGTPFGTNMTAEDIETYNKNLEEALSYLKLLMGI